MHQTKWRRLDNSANVFPAISGKSQTSVYRVSAILRKDTQIDPNILKKSLIKTLEYFTAYNVRLKHGLFWDYFETCRLEPVVEEERDFPGGFIDIKKNNLFLFRTSFYKNKINLDIYHALTDATGAFRFLKSICYQYIAALYPEKFTEKIYGVSYANDVEDGYLKNYVKMKPHKLDKSRAHSLRGPILPLGAAGELAAHIPMDEMKTVAKKYGCTISQYLAARLIWGIYRPDVKYPINVFIPVNLRPMFGSSTSLNFFSGITVSVTPQSVSDFFSVVNEVKNEFKLKLTKENMLGKMAYNVGSGYSVPIRAVPLPVKRLVLKIFYRLGIRNATISLSNIGEINVEEKFKNYFEGFIFLMTPSPKEPVKSSAISFNGDFTFTISSVLDDASLQKRVFRGMASDGLNITLESNGVFYETMR
jgi:NRPS condensation-like uncharacterized protein